VLNWSDVTSTAKGALLITHLGTTGTEKHIRISLRKHQPNLKDEIHFKGGRIVTP